MQAASSSSLPQRPGAQSAPHSLWACLGGGGGEGEGKGRGERDVVYRSRNYSQACKKPGREREGREGREGGREGGGEEGREGGGGGQTCGADVDHGGPTEVDAGQPFHGGGHGGREHHRLAELVPGGLNVGPHLVRVLCVVRVGLGGGCQMETRSHTAPRHFTMATEVV